MTSKYRNLVSTTRSLTYDELRSLVQQLQNNTVLSLRRNRQFNSARYIDLYATGCGYHTDQLKVIRLTNSQRRQFLKRAESIPEYEGERYGLRVSDIPNIDELDLMPLLRDI